MAAGSGFGIFIADLYDLALGLERPLRTNRTYVASSRRALAVLRAYRPADDGEAILLETVVEHFEDLLRRAGGAR
jgi:hypothetical protein